MARVVQILDDITAEGGAATRLFAVGPDAYSIDLTDEGYEQLLAVLDPYIKHGMRTGKNQNFNGRPTPAPVSESAKRHDPNVVAALKAWAAEHGIPVREGGGRLPDRLWAAYHANDPQLALEPRRRQPQQRLLEAG